MFWNEDQSPRVKKERKPTLRGKWESVFSGSHMDNVSKETHAVSVMTHWLPAAVAKMVEFVILRPKLARMALSRVARQNVVGHTEKNDNDRFTLNVASGNCWREREVQRCPSRLVL